MSRAYRIKVTERLKRVLKASDHVTSELEMLDILPADQMAQLLTKELEQRGFEKKGEKLVRREKGIVIQIDPNTAGVLVRAEQSENIDLDVSKQVWADADQGRELAAKTRQATRAELKKSLEQDAEQKKAALQQKVTDQLEGRLLDLQKELNQVVNKVTAEALKTRAAQIGNIKELSEDPASGSLTIVLEV